MPPEAAVDELFEIRNSFYLGSYQQCISEVQKLRTQNADNRLQADLFMYRSYIAQHKYSVPLDEIKPSSAPELRAVRLYAEYLSNSSERSRIVKELEQNLASGADASTTLFLISGLIFAQERNFESALRILNEADDLECLAVGIQCLLNLDRVDLAVQEVKKMQEKDEDATITNLAQAWTNMAMGKEKLQDAFYIYQEMIDKYSPTAYLLNGQAGALILQQKYEQAETVLQEAISKDSNNAETLSNLILVSQFLGKPIEVSNRYISQLKEGHSDSQWARDYRAKEKEFDRLCLQYAPA